MITAIVYDTTTNKVVKQTTVKDEETLADYVSDGEAYILGFVPVDRLQYASVVDGELQFSQTEEQQEIEEKTAFFYAARNARLADTDWTQANDSPLSDSKKTEWQTYRQQLRDMPQGDLDPLNPNWPSPPG